MKNYFKKMRTKANEMVVRADVALHSKRGEGFVDTGVKIIIAVVVGAVILAGLYALFDGVIIPTLEDRIDDMFNYKG